MAWIDIINGVTAANLASVNGVTKSNISKINGIPEDVATMWAEAFIVIDTGAETNKSHTTEADRALTGTSTEQGDWSGQWTSPDLELPADGFYMFGYCDFLRQSGVVRSGSICQIEHGGSKLGISGSSTFGYNRNAGGADESSRHLVGVKHNCTSGYDITVREGTQLNGLSPRTGDYNRTSGDPRGMWALNLKNIGDYLIANAQETGETANYGSATRPIDLGTPSATDADRVIDPINFNTTIASSGTSISRSGSTFTLASNKIVLCTTTVQQRAISGRSCLIVRIDRDDSPEVYSSAFGRDSTTDQLTTSITFPIITGTSSEDIKIKQVNQVETSFTGGSYDAAASFIDVTGQDVCVLTKTDSDITSILSSTRGTGITFPTDDEIQVDTDTFSHSSTNTSRITNNSGGEITVLAGFNVFVDRSSQTSSNRKTPMTQILKNGTALDYTIASEYSRGQESSQDTFVAGYSYCAPVVMAANDYIEMDLFDLTYATNEDIVVNCTDGKAIYFWAIKI